MRTSIPVGRRRIPDADLYLREGQAAIVAAAGDHTAPEYTSPYVDLGPGEHVGAVEIVKAAFTPNAANDNIVEILVVGANDAETERRTLAAFILGANAVLSDTDDLDLSKSPVSVFFSNAIGQKIYPKVRLEVVVSGTAGGALNLQFDAFVTRGPRS